MDVPGLALLCNSLAALIHPGTGELPDLFPRAFWYRLEG